MARVTRDVCTVSLLSSMALAGAARGAGEPPLFEASVIGTISPGALVAAMPMSLSENGRIVGYRPDLGGGSAALNWRAGMMLNLGVSPAYGRAFSTRANIYNRVVGGAYEMDGNGGIAASHAILWTAGVAADLGTLGGLNAVATGLNDSGRIVGYSTTAGEAQTRAFIYQNGAMQAISTIPGATESYAFDISNTGYVAGTAIAGAPTRPFLWHAGTAQELPLPPTRRAGSAVAVNNAGWAVGSYELDLNSGSFAAGFWKNGHVFNLGNLGGPEMYATAADVNNAGQIVGTSGSPDGRTGFLWQNGRMYDLRSLLINGASSLEIVGASGINDSGQIAVSAMINGVETAVLLTPIIPGVPGPGVGAVLAIAGVVSARRRRA